MSVSLKVGLEVDLDSSRRLKEDIDNIIDWIPRRYREAAAELADISQGAFTRMGGRLEKTWGDALHKVAALGRESLGEMFDEVLGGCSQMEDAVWRFSDKLEGAFGHLGEALQTGLFESLGEGLRSSAEALIARPVSDAFHKAFGALGAYLPEALVDPLKQALKGMLGWFKDAFSSVLGGLFDKVLDGVGSWLGLGAAGPASGGAAAGAGALGQGLAELGIGAGAAGAGGMGAGGSALGYGLADLGIGGGGGVGGGGGGGGGVAAGGGSLAPWLAGAGIFGGVELFANLMDMPGPVEGITNALGTILGLSEGGGHTSQSARQYLAGDLDYLQRARESEGGFSLDQLQDAAVEIERIAERAGLSAEEIDLLVLGVDELNQKLVELETARSEAVESGAAEEQLAAIEEQMALTQEQILQLQELGAATGLPIEGLGALGAAMVEAAQAGELLDAMVGRAITQYYDWNGSTEQLRGQLGQLVAVLGEAGVNTAGLSATVERMTAGLAEGTVTTGQIAAQMDKEFKAALESAAKKGELTAQKMRELAQAIKSIPDRTILLDWNWRKGPPPQGGGETKHLGGLVMHQGGWLSAAPRLHHGSLVRRLASDEVPIVAQRGEFVVRAPSVTAATLPWLQALNQTGRPLEAPAGGQVVNLHVEVHGNLLGSEEDLEDLARLIEDKLKDIERRRIHA